MNVVYARSQGVRKASPIGGRGRVPLEVQVSASHRIDELIAELAKNGDAHKLERLLEHRKHLLVTQAKGAFDVAFSMLQTALPVLNENGEIRDQHGKLLHSYALWEDINEVIKPILAEHGFALWFKTDVDGNRVTVVAILSHIGGHKEETTLRFPADLTGGKNAVQAIGSSTSYGKRYTASALLNLTSRGEDDDGTGGGSEPTITDEQLTCLADLLTRHQASESKLLAYLDVETLAALPASRFERAVQAIKAKGTCE